VNLLIPFIIACPFVVFVIYYFNSTPEVTVAVHKCAPSDHNSKYSDDFICCLFHAMQVFDQKRVYYTTGCLFCRHCWNCCFLFVHVDIMH